MYESTNPKGVTPAKKWNSSTEEERLGFSERDKLITSAISTPMVIPKLGKSYQSFMSHYPTPIVGTSRKYMATWASDHTDLSTVPGIMVLDFEPIFALSDPNMRAETGDIFVTLWQQMRIVNNMTEKFQPADLQIIFCALMELKMHIANIRRILNIGKSVLNHELNEYYYGKDLLSSLGFSMTETEIRQNWAQWWQFFNQSLIGKLTSIRWMGEDIVPGLNRWAGMCREIYKDNPVYTDYCQMFMFKPRYINNIYAGWQESLHAWLWQFEHLTIGGSATTGVAKLNEYMQQVFNMINNIFYDDSSASIIATINAIEERKLSSDFKADYIYTDADKLPWEGEPVPLTYDLNTLIAIHNATVCIGITVHPPVQDVENGTLEQNVTVPNNAYSAASAMMVFPKVINLPNFGATTDDFINATQWTVVNTPYGLSSEVAYLRPGSIGTEVISACGIYTNRYNQITNTYTLQRFVFNQDLDIHDPHLDNLLERITLASNFMCAPIMYVMDWSAATESVPGSVLYAVGQMEVQYVGDFGTISQIHTQFLRNFWGYPYAKPESGTFKTSYSE